MVLSLKRFEGKVAIVSGASSGIGAAIVEQLVRRGLVVAGLGRRIDKIELLSKQLSKEKGKLYPFRCDMTKEDDIVATIKQVAFKLGPIHILVNNAGLSQKASLLKGDTHAWKTVLDTNILGVSIATREAVQNMAVNNTEGHIINMNSILGHVVLDIPALDGVYTASKFAVTALTETLRNELSREKLLIKTTSISPGLVKTDFQAVAGMPSELQLPALSSEDVADAVVYALSTPANINVNDINVQAIA
ncbi:farnesol dehydrogenase-like [Euwallacea fornicatus]|uniref:farnesol dehydrogenase-like n=1 Tax=Euwallacea fornicatus TaxID=995702 RepID=UPI00338EA6E9